MSLDKFGRRVGVQTYQPTPRLQLAYTSEGDINMENLRICNLKQPTESLDAVNKKYVDDLLQDVQHKYITLIEKLIIINKFIDRKIPIADEHMATKIYVDESISRVNLGLHRDLKSTSDDLGNKMSDEKKILEEHINIINELKNKIEVIRVSSARSATATGDSVTESN